MIDDGRTRFGTACVLAGGQGRRMEGRDKLALEFRGERLLARIERQLRGRFADLVAVSNRPDAFRGLGYRVVPDTFSGAGPLAGLHAGLVAARGEWVYLVACDMPFFSAAHVDALAAAVAEAEAAGRSPVAAAVRSGAFFEPFHALYSRSLVGSIEAAFAAPGRAPSIQSLLRSLPMAFLDSSPAVDGSSLFVNVNTPVELAAAEAGTLIADLGGTVTLR